MRNRQKMCAKGLSCALTVTFAGAFSNTALATIPNDYYATVLGDNPAGYWRLGETSGTVAYDSSPAKINGTYTGTYTDTLPPTLNQPGAIADDSDGSAYFYLSNNYKHWPVTQSNWVMVPHNANQAPTTASLTLEAWFTLPNGHYPQTYAALINKATANDQDGYGLYWYSDSIYFYINKINIRARALITGTDTSKFQHVVGVYNGTELRIFLNGVRVDLQTLTANEGAGRPVNASTAPLYIGKGWTYGWSGDIDEAAIYDQALTDDEVAQHYQASRPEPIFANQISAAGDVPISTYDPGEYACQPGLLIQGPTPDANNNPVYGNITYPPPPVQTTGPDCRVAIRFCDANGNQVAAPTEAQLNAPASSTSSCAPITPPSIGTCSVDPATAGGACRSAVDCASDQVCGLMCDDAACANPLQICGKYMAGCTPIPPQSSYCNDTGFRQCPDSRATGTVTAADALADFPPQTTPQTSAQPATPYQPPAFASLGDGTGACAREPLADGLGASQTKAANHDKGNDQWGVFLKPLLNYSTSLAPKDVLGQGDIDIQAQAGATAGGRAFGHTINAIDVNLRADLSNCEVSATAQFKVFGDQIAPGDLFGDTVAAGLPSLAADASGVLVTPSALQDACKTATTARVNAVGNLRKAIWAWQGARKFYLQHGTSVDLCQKTNENLHTQFDCNDPNLLANFNVPNSWKQSFQTATQDFATADSALAAAASAVGGNGEVELSPLRHRYNLKAVDATIPIGPFDVDLAIQAYGSWELTGGLDVGIAYDGSVPTLVTPSETTPQTAGDIRAIGGPNITPGVDLGVSAFAGVGIPGVSVGVEGSATLLGLTLPSDARVTIGRVSLPDTRDVASSDWAGTPIPSIPSKVYHWESGWSYGTSVNLHELDGELDAALRVDLLFWSDTFRMKIFGWKGFSQQFPFVGSSYAVPLKGPSDYGKYAPDYAVNDAALLQTTDVPAAPDGTAIAPALYGPDYNCANLR